MKKLVSLFVCVMICLSMANSAVCAFQGRLLSEASDWARDDIRRMRLLFDSYGNYSFENFQNEISREEFCKEIIFFSNYLINCGRFEEIKEIPERKDATFVDTASWYADRAYGLGFMNGTSEGTFSPERLVTREEAVVTLYRMFNAFGFNMKTLPQGTATIRKSFQNGQRMRRMHYGTPGRSDEY